jgi:hypothetical protein
LIACSRAPVPAAAQATSSAPQLTPYTAPDQSASAGVPSGWKVTAGSQTVITMTGPSNESITLGNTMVVRNAAFQLGQKPANGIDLSMPNSASLAQKFTWIVQQNAAIGGKPAPQLSITSATPLQLPATLGQCTRIVASDPNGPAGATTIAALMCSLPIDSGGTYKVMMKLAQAPTAVAQQEGALASAVFASYQIPQAWLQKKLAPNTPAPASAGSASGAPMSAAQTNAETAAILRSTAAQQAAVNNSANCFDLAVLRETPQRLLPRSCGGMAPN